jgi:hypothetical protein
VTWKIKYCLNSRRLHIVVHVVHGSCIHILHVALPEENADDGPAVRVEGEQNKVTLQSPHVAASTLEYGY